MDATFSEANRPPQFNQGRYIYIMDRSTEIFRFQCHAQNQPFLVKKRLKRLKTRENTISWKCDFVKNWLSPHFNKTKGISFVDWNIKDFTWLSPWKPAICSQERENMTDIMKKNAILSAMIFCRKVIDTSFLLESRNLYPILRYRTLLTSVWHPKSTIFSLKGQIIWILISSAL